MENKDVVQSYLLSSARYDFNVYEKRILYRLVELCQPLTKGQKLDSNFMLSKDLWGLTDVKIPISYLLTDEKDKHHSRIKDALKKLNEKKMTYEDEKQWKIIRIIELPKVDKYDNSVEFKMHPEIFHAILNFSKGFKRYELETIMSFESVYAMRFYELFSEQKTPISYTIEKLKIMFSIENKYKNRPADFIKYVVLPAKSELDKKSPWSFDYEAVKIGKKINSLTFYPYYVPQHRDSELEKQKLQKKVSLNWDLNKDVIYYLKNFYRFDTQGIKNNIDLFKAAENKFDLTLFLAELRRNAENIPNRAGYLINALKIEIKKSQKRDSKAVKI